MRKVRKVSLNNDDCISAHRSSNNDHTSVSLFSHILVNAEFSNATRKVPIRINGIPEAYHTRIIPTPYDHTAENDQISTLWTAISDNDPFSVEYNKMRFGASTTSVAVKLYFRDVGVRGNNGKSAIQAAVVGAVGTITNLNAEDIYCSPTSAKTAKGHTDSMMHALSGTGCFVSESEQRNSKEVLNEAFIKQWAGEATMTGSKKGVSTETLTIQGMMYIQSNQIENFVNKVSVYPALNF